MYITLTVKSLAYHPGADEAFLVEWCQSVREILDFGVFQTAGNGLSWVPNQYILVLVWAGLRGGLDILTGLPDCRFMGLNSRSFKVTVPIFKLHYQHEKI